IVFSVVPAPLSGDAMGAVFRRFDVVAIVCGVIVLACEAVRIRVASASSSGVKMGPSVTDRLRTALAVLATAAAVYGGARLSPAIVELHAAGAMRGFGEDGERLHRLHKRAELIAKVEVVAGLLLLALQVTTLRRESQAGPTARAE